MRIQRLRWLSLPGAALILVLGLSLIWGGLPVAWGAPGAQGSSPAPQVFDTVPLPGEELALDGPVSFYFDLPMDTASVEAAFSVDPAVEGQFAWTDDAGLTFTPSGKYERAAEVVFTIGTGALSAEGVALEEAFTLKLQTIGYLEVAEVLPADDLADVDTESVITVVFNRPVVPLLSVEQMDELPQPLVFDPPVEGAGEWLNTSIYLFTPETELRGGTDYTVTVTAGLEDVTGGILNEDYQWSFSTLRPDVLEIDPWDGSESVLLEEPMSVIFSQEMDPAATETAIIVELLGPTGGDTYLPEPLPVTGTFEWSEDFRTVTFQPDELLELGSAYRLTVDAEKALSVTGATLREGATSTFYTVPYPEIRYTSPSAGEAEAYPYGGFTIYFVGPMDLESLKDKVIIDPEPWREFDTYFYDYEYSYNLSFDTEPSTSYTITILPGMADRYGNTIDEGMVVSYTTAAYPPELTIQSPGRTGMYSSYNPSTRVFVTHRNVSRLDMGLWRVSLARFAQLAGPESYDAWRNYTPSPNDLLRRWSLNVSSQDNVRRYELMLISDKGPSGIANVECLGAPDPQVKVGDVAIVTREDERPLNVRQEPNLGAQPITQVLPDETFQIIGGPVCEGGYLWWQLRLNNDTTGWAAEGDLENYYFAPLGQTPVDPNAPPAVDDAAEIVPESLAPGIYYLEVNAPEMEGWDDWGRRHVMLVQSANITLKFSPDTALAWVSDMQTGAPAAGVPVIFYNGDFNPVAQAVTDENGLAVATIPHMDTLYTTMYATVDEGGVFGFAVSGWAEGMDPWQFDIFSDYEPEDFTVYMYTDRPIYRPGQPVFFKGILRNRDDVTYTIPANLKEVPVKAYDDRGEVIFEDVLPVTAGGSFSGEVKLDGEAPLGYYRIVAEVNSNRRDSFGVSFNVAEYRAPEFQVDVTADKSAVVQGDKINVLVEGRYFFGGPVSNADVSYTVLSNDYYFNYTGDEPGYWSFTDTNYDFYAPEYYGPNGGVVAEGSAVTDELGRYMIELDADLGEKGSSQTYTIEARIVDESDQLVAGRTQVIVHQGQVYVGLQPEDYVGRAEKENAVNIMTVDWDSEPAAGQEVAYEVVERRWFSVQEEDDFGRTNWTWDVEEIAVEGAKGTVTTGDDGLAQVTFTPPAGGAYKMYARTKDEHGNEITSSTFMWVSGSEFVNWRQENSNRIQLITDKDEYKVGDTAQILIPSPWQGEAYALVTVERGDILTSEVLKLETNSTIYELPISADYAPNVYFSVVLVKGVDENNPVTSFRMGVAELPVDTSQLVMDLEISSNIDVEAGEFAGPGDQVEYTIKATDWQGTPVPNAEIGVNLTDLAVLSIANSNVSDLLPFFYFERGVSVRTASSLTISVDQVTQTIVDTIKGGGGGGGGGGIFEVRQEFVDTPLWEPTLITNANGEAVVEVTLPDNLTTWRLNARAVTTGADGPMLVGENTFDLISTKPVLIRPGTPRFFVVGDKATLAAVVNNNTSEDLLTEVMLEGTGFRLAEGVEPSQMVNIPAKGRARVDWQIEVLDVREIDATFYANAGD
ncbi:MAG: Ig-like domain-containing protein, partial [Chloroflexi bacterium]|nr:Ig-like domain-containing protein [Chloroflexota bacterium]